MSMLQRFEQLNQIPQWQIERICVELENFFRCNAMHGTTLHDDAITFPMVMNRFFGNDSGVSVYIRNVVQEQMNSAFSICYDFFSPNGPLFWYFKRLFESSVPFLLPIIQLPEQLQSILASDTYPAFYKNLIANDIPYCFTLQLNAFQYFMFKFALSGLISHKNMNPPMGRETIDRQTETLYLALAAEYMFTYLPRAQPSDIPPSKGSIKSLVIKSPRPIAKTKYLNLENLPYVTPRLINPAMDSTTNLDVWRAESIASIFLDVWLSYTPSADGMYLPSVELLRCIRVLVKQIHAFSGIGYNIDNCPMEELRRATELQLRERIEPFFMSLFDIWPLDGSLIDLIELWLSYIQPWRYVHNRHLSKSPPPICEHAIVHRFSRFIVANLLSYTQPIVKLVPRLAQFDMTSPISIKILTRLLKVVSSRTMLNFIKRNEIILYRLKQQYDISSLTINISILPEEDNPPIDLEEVSAVSAMSASETSMLHHLPYKRPYSAARRKKEKAHYPFTVSVASAWRWTISQSL
ncbi:hypothetical protein AND_000958 [Anopheles darlingi]|uniref:Sphingomyelin phosphodiesterase 4 n=1 Tax=Anopheles darlingi TaxID=43151 RepID=W5JV96_ANODA|nr:hypothetical protein AND_000958 [Anopheles darlingi]